MTVTNVHKAKLVEGFLSHWRYMGKRTAAGGSACFLFSSFCFLFFEGQNCFFVSFPQYVSAFVPAGVFLFLPMACVCCVAFRFAPLVFYSTSFSRTVHKHSRGHGTAHCCCYCYIAENSTIDEAWLGKRATVVLCSAGVLRKAFEQKQP